MELRAVAQVVMDNYYQNYKSDDDFFELDDFMVQVVAAYNKVLDDEYSQNKVFNKQIFGFSIVDISHDWLKKVVVKVTKDDFDGDYIAKLPTKAWSPSFDFLGTGVQEVNIKGCSEAIRIGRTDVWKLHTVAAVDKTFYIAEYDQVRFKKPVGLSEGVEVQVLYVPALSADAPTETLPDSKVFQVQTIALQFMVAARDGVIVDTTSNQNPNKTIQTEADKASLKG